VNDPEDAADRRAIAAWCLFDWANSPFPTVVITFVFATYFTTAVAPDTETGTALWGWAMSVSGIVLAVTGPIVGAVADQSGRRKPWLLVLSLACAACGAALWFVAPKASFVAVGLVLAGLGNLTFELGQVFYNAMLPDLAPSRWMGRISGWGWALGYAGGLVCLAVALFVFVQPAQPPFGLDRAAAEHVRIVGPLVAVWFVVFALPLFLLTPDRPARRATPGPVIRRGLATLWRTLREVRRYQAAARFLLARMIYIDGVNTLFAFGGIYAAGTFGMAMDEVLKFAILLNVTAGLGAFGFAWVDDWMGPRRTVLAALAAMIAASAAVLLVDSKTWFYGLGMLLGIFIGPVQAASRTFMAHLAPPEIRTEAFGLYALSGRVTTFLGPALVGWLTFESGSQRIGMSAILAFLVLGLLLLLRVPDVRAPVSAESGAPR
jgi:UMF1 family MFS transporter